MGTALRARQVTPVTAVAFGVFMLGVGISRVPLESLIHQTELGGSAAEWLTSAAALVPVAAVGAFLAARRPRNPIGWIVLAIFLLAAAPWWLRRCSIRCVAGVQRAVDRRFNRAHYNAETVVAAFTMRLRQTVDLDVVRADLVDAVQQAFEPAHVSVWLAAGKSTQHAPVAAGGHRPAGSSGS